MTQVVSSDPGIGVWDQFWFAPDSVAKASRIRAGLCLCAAAYFVSCWSDISVWYGPNGSLSSTRVAEFLHAGDLEGPARWIVSPLFLTDSVAVYQLYLALALAACFLVAAGRGGRVACWALWLMLVGWANRSMIVSGLAETLLSLGLFAAAIAPPGGIHDARLPEKDWTAGLSLRLMSVQVTLVGVATFVTMLGGRVWFNGLGAYALAAPAEDRTIDWTSNTPLVNTLVHDCLSHMIVIALPLGFFFAWTQRWSRVGLAIVVLWCLAIALLGSHWLYATCIAVMALSIHRRQ